MLTPIKSEMHIVLTNGARIQLTPADFSKFFNNCYSMGIEIDDFEDLFLDISDAVTDQTRDESLSKELKTKLIFLRKLNFLFKSMLLQAVD